MKIYTKVVFNMTTFDVIKEESFEYNGDIALCGGGGGPSGEVKFPDYMEKVHVNWLTGGTIADPAPSLQGIQTPMDRALGIASAYNTAAAYSTITDLGNMQVEHDRVQTLVDALVPTTRVLVGGGLPGPATESWDEYMTISKDVIENNVVNDAEIDASIVSFRNQQDPDRRLSVARLAGSMGDLNAIHSSQFIVGLAIIETEFEKGVDNFSANLRIKLKSDKQQVILAGTQQLIAMLELKLRLTLNVAEMQTDISTKTIISRSEEVARDLEIDVKDDLWDLSIFQYGANVLASINGSANPIMNQPSQLQSALGGSLRGAAAGAAIGTAVPGLGTAIGAGIGGLIGAFGG